MSRRDRRHRKPMGPVRRIELSRDELRLLLEISGYYFRSLGPFRHVVRFSSGPEMRSRYAFVRDESAVLRSFATAMIDRMEPEAETTRVEITIPALVAYWGRLLASLHSTRSRRRMKEGEITRREALATRLHGAVRDAVRPHGAAVQNAIATRPEKEQAWMREALSDDRPLAAPENSV